MEQEYCYHCMRPLKGRACRYGCKPSAAPAPNQLSLGTLLKGGEYLVGEMLGSGGFGITYIGCIRQLGLRVAIKEYFPSGLCTRDCRVSNLVTPLDPAPFQDGKEYSSSEARLLAEFDSEPGIVRVRDIFEENGTAYIVMDYLDGVTLQKCIAANGSLPLDTLLPALRPVMQSLQKMHRCGIIHRDITPDNLMMLPDGSLTLLDFGSACVFDKTMHIVMLKLAFAPPEQHAASGKLGPWTDVYSLCATIYACITGQKPPDAITRSIKDTLQPPSSFGVRISKQQEAALMKGLSLSTEVRIQSVDELERALYQEADAAQQEKETTKREWLLPAVLSVATLLSVIFAVSMISKRLPAADTEPESVVLSFSQDVLELSPGERGTLPLRGLPSDSPDPIRWTSSDSSVASVDSSGLVTALAPGSAEISASLDAASAAFTVRVVPSDDTDAAATAAVNEPSTLPEEPEAPRLERTEIYELDAESASGSEVYEYDASGRLSGVRLLDASGAETGSCVIESYNTEGYPLSGQLYDAAGARSGSEEYAYDREGALTQTTRYDKNGACVSVELYEYLDGQRHLSFSYWSSSGQPSGALTACTAYSATGDTTAAARRIYSGGTFADAASLFHCADGALYLNTASIELREEESASLIPVVWPDGLDPKSLQWTSSAPGIVRVGDGGQLTALAAGEAVVTASGGGTSAQCVVVVKPAQYVVKAGYSALHLLEGASFQLPALATKNGRRVDAVTFQSSDSDILSVDSDGTLHAKSSLSLTTVTVTVSCGGVSDQCTVTVYPPHVKKRVLLSYDNANGHYENQYDALGRLICQTRSDSDTAQLYSETFDPQENLYAYLRWLLRDTRGNYTELLSLRSDGTDRLVIDEQVGTYTWEENIFVRIGIVSRDFSPQRGSCTVWNSRKQQYTQTAAPIEYTYDKQGRLTMIRLPERGVQTSYVYSYETDEDTLPESITKLDASGKTYSKIDCVYDASSGRLTEIKRWDQYWGVDYTAEYIYDIVGTLTGVRLVQDGVTTEYQFAFNNASLLSETVTTGGSSDTYGCTYGDIWVYQ